MPWASCLCTLVKALCRRASIRLLQSVESISPAAGRCCHADSRGDRCRARVRPLSVLDVGLWQLEASPAVVLFGEGRGSRSRRVGLACTVWDMSASVAEHERGRRYGDCCTTLKRARLETKRECLWSTHPPTADKEHCSSVFGERQRCRASARRQ
jgi:hypothetical protein